MSSNVNEVIRAVLNSLFNFFVYKKILNQPKAPKSPKSTKSTKSIKTQPSKSKKRHKWTKIKNELKKHRRGKKSLIHLFAFLCLWRKEIETSLQCTAMY